MRSFVIIASCALVAAHTQAADKEAVVHLVETQTQQTNEYKRFHTYSVQTHEYDVLPEYDLSYAINMWDGEWNRRASAERNDGAVAVYHNSDSVIWDDLIGSNTLVLTSKSIKFTDKALHLPFDSVSYSTTSNRESGIAKGYYKYKEDEFTTVRYSYYDGKGITSIRIPWVSVEICAELETYPEYNLTWPFAIFPKNRDMTLFSLSGGFEHENRWYSPYSISLMYDLSSYFRSSRSAFFGKTDSFGFEDETSFFRTRRCYHERSPYYLLNLQETSGHALVRTMFTVTCNFICKSALYDDHEFFYTVSSNMYANGFYQPCIYSIQSNSNLKLADSIMVTTFGDSFDTSATVTNLYETSSLYGVTYREAYKTTAAPYNYFLDDNTTKIGGYYSPQNGESRLFSGKIYSVRVYRGDDCFRTKIPSIERHRRNAKVDYDRFYKSE